MTSRGDTSSSALFEKGGMDPGTGGSGFGASAIGPLRSIGSDRGESGKAAAAFSSSCVSR